MPRCSICRGQVDYENAFFCDVCHNYTCLFSGKVCNATLLDAPGKYYRQILLPTRVYYSGEMLFFEEVEVGVRKNTGIFHHSSRVKDIKDVGQNTFRFETATSAAYIVSLL